MKLNVSSLLIAAILSVFAPADALAASATTSTSNQDSSHPLVMQEAANAVASAKVGTLQPFTHAPSIAAVGGSGGPQREVFGFALLSSLADPTIGYPSWNFSLLSTVAVFGLHIQDDGHIANDSGWAVWSSSQMTGLLSKAHASGVKVVATIILQDFAAGTPHMCAGLTSQSLANTVSQTVAAVAARGADGVNIDYEGLQVSCANGVNPRAAVTGLSRQLKTQLAPGSYLSVDTYASSAGDPAGFFDIPGLSPNVDSFFVMAYDSDWSNYNHPPLNCSRYCLNPVSPLTGYFYNDTRAASEYSTAVTGSKVILGLPYYGRYACVSSRSANSYPAPGAATNSMTYRASVGIANDPSNSSYALQRDANDANGLTPWSTWTSSSNPACAVESYWDDVSSLGQKYDLVNRANLRGVGLWNLNLGGGSPELWSTLSTYFACPVTISAPPMPATTEFSLALSTGNCSVTSFEVEQFDSTLNQGWFGVSPGQPASGSGTAVVEGYPAHSYRFRARAHSTAGVTSSWSYLDVSVASSAAYSHPFKGLYTLDGYGGVHAIASPPLGGSAYWAGWAIARSAKASPSVAQAGLVLDGYGGLHAYGGPGVSETSASSGHYWPGWDIARDFAFLPDGSGGFVLDGYGGLHPFRLNGSNASFQALGNPYWGWDIARKVVIFSDGSGGYVLDGWGGLHPFGINGPPPAWASASLIGGSYWPGWDIARDIALVPGNGGHAGYLLDGYGGTHPFHPNGDGSAMPPPIAGPYWGTDIAGSFLFLPGSATAGYVMDDWGGIHPVGGAPPLSNYDYWPNWKIARVVWGS